MTKTKLSLRSTPAAIAAATLEGIASDAAGFDMRGWCERPDYGRPLEPGDAPSHCGTTLCAAGWVAHVLGYVIFPGGACVPADDRMKYPTCVEVLANQALRLRSHDGNLIWYCTDRPELALYLLRAIADGATGDQLWDLSQTWGRER